MIKLSLIAAFTFAYCALYHRVNDRIAKNKNISDIEMFAYGAFPPLIMVLIHT
jgi:hypothetical protein